MQSTVRRTLTGILSAAALSAGLIAVSPPAAAEPTVYDPELTQCSHLFRTPLDMSKRSDTVWSPFGAANIACYHDGTGVERYYQRDPWGRWHAMNELRPHQWFYVIFADSSPDSAHWRGQQSH